MAEGGLIQLVEPFKEKQEAEQRADHLAEKLNDESDDIVVWDLDDGATVYSPLGDYDEDDAEGEE